MIGTTRARRGTAECGAALLALLLIVSVAGLALFVRHLSSAEIVAERDKLTQAALRDAKEALIAYAATHSTLPGKLPCPEDTTLIGFPNEGNAANTCSASAADRIGRLPWRTLGLGRDFADANGDKLWYAVSSGFGSAPINSDSLPDITVTGITDAVVAIVFSPGSPLPGQDRSVLAVANYLDEDNADGDPQKFALKPRSATFNDRGVTITKDELFSVVERRVANEVTYALMEYYCGFGNVSSAKTCITPPSGKRYFPRPALFSNTSCLGTSAIPSQCISDGSAREGRLPANPNEPWTDVYTLSILRGSTGGAGGNWFQSNGWRELVYYAVGLKCIEGTIDCGGAGTLSVSGQSKNVVVIVGGRALLGQGRAVKTNISDYYEDQNASALDDTFVQLNRTVSFNDVLSTLP